MAGAAIEIKMGQGAKPGIGGHLPGTKIVGDVSRTRMIPRDSDAISPAAPPRYLFHRGSPAADLLLKGSNTVPETGDRQGSRGPQHRGHRQRHCAGRRGHHCHRRLPGRHRRRAPPGSATMWAFPLSWRWRPWTSGCGRRASASGVPDRRRQHPFLCRRGQGRGSGGDRLLYRHGGADRHGLPPLPHLSERQMRLGHCHAAPGAGQAAGPRRGHGTPHQSDDGVKHEIMEIMGRHGDQFIEALRGNRLMLRAVGLTEKGCPFWAWPTPESKRQKNPDPPEKQRRCDSSWIFKQRVWITGP